jgi:hypothetical protein
MGNWFNSPPDNLYTTTFIYYFLLFSSIPRLLIGLKKKLRSISVFDGNNNASWSRRRSKKEGGPYKTPTTKK